MVKIGAWVLWLTGAPTQVTGAFWNNLYYVIKLLIWWNNNMDWMLTNKGEIEMIQLTTITNPCDPND